MRRLCLALLLLALSGAAAFAATALPSCVAPIPALSAAETAPLQLAQSSCRASCSSRRGYCLSSCRDRQCRAICNDLYYSCVASCR